MWRLRHRVARAASVLFLCALLLPSLALRAHRHADHAAARPCALCVVADHAPAASAPLVATVAPVLHGVAAAPAAPVVPARRDRTAATGRAPPRSRFTRVA